MTAQPPCEHCGTKRRHKTACPANTAAPSRSAAAALWLRDHGGTTASAGEAHGVTRQAVSLAWHSMFPGVPTPEAAAQAAKTARVLELAESGLTSGEISSQVGLSRRAAYQLARRHGRGVKSMARDSSESADAAVQDVLAGASATDAAIDAGISAETLRRRMRQMGVSARTNPAERRDGRVARAVARVLAGESVPAACQAEHCASSGVYTELEKHKKKRVLAR